MSPPLLAIAVALLAVLFAFFFFRRKKIQQRVFFIGPHSAGKTTAILKMAEMDRPTVTTLINHRAYIRNMEITELTQNESANHFISRFSLNPLDRFIFFLKNEEELSYFPDLRDFDITFVMWWKTEHRMEDKIIYLDENPEILIDLINRQLN